MMYLKCTTAIVVNNNLHCINSIYWAVLTQLKSFQLQLQWNWIHFISYMELSVKWSYVWS